ncbi:MULTISPECIES: hypothetical protein [unclassified Blastococcus]|nr:MULTISPECIES: hypothetical protein [unclassified Blastococcus]
MAVSRVGGRRGLHACAAAWSARRLLEGRGERVGDGRLHSGGRPMRVCW